MMEYRLLMKDQMVTYTHHPNKLKSIHMGGRHHKKIHKHQLLYLLELLEEQLMVQWLQEEQWLLLIK